MTDKATGKVLLNSQIHTAQAHWWGLNVGEVMIIIDRHF